MAVRPDQLSARLQRGLDSIYLVAGEEPLTVDECADAVRAAARDAGFGDREVLDAGRGFDWAQLGASALEQSLFGGRRLLELRLPGGRPGNEGSKAITQWAEKPDTETLLLILAHGFESSQAKSKWAKAVEKAGTFVMVYPMNAAQLPRWIEARMRGAGLEPSRDAVRLLAERTEGNLLAADQEIRKLALLADGGRVDEAAVLESVSDSARFQAFGMLDAALEGDAARVVRSLRGLRAEGAELAVVMGAMVWQLHQLTRVAAQSRGQGREAAFRKARVWPKKKALLEQALDRLPESAWPAFIEQASQVDRQLKGRAAGDAWIGTERLLVSLALGEAPRTEAP